MGALRDNRRSRFESWRFSLNNLKKINMGTCEFGKCEICGKETTLDRTYFYYPIHSIAKEDIEVYKIGSPNKKKNRFNCLYMDTFFYIKNENTPKINLELQVQEDNIIKGRTIYFIDEGYHCYDEYTKLRPLFTNPIKGHKYDFSIRNCDTFYHKVCAGKFIIPKDSKYYVNNFGEIVSEKLIFKEFLDIKFPITEPIAFNELKPVIPWYKRIFK